MKKRSKIKSQFSLFFKRFCEISVIKKQWEGKARETSHVKDYHEVLINLKIPGEYIVVTWYIIYGIYFIKAY